MSEYLDYDNSEVSYVKEKDPRELNVVNRLQETKDYVDSIAHSDIDDDYKYEGDEDIYYERSEEPREVNVVDVIERMKDYIIERILDDSQTLDIKMQREIDNLAKKMSELHNGAVIDPSESGSSSSSSVSIAVVNSCIESYIREHDIASSTKISQESGNAITEKADGIYVPTVSVLDESEDIKYSIASQSGITNVEDALNNLFNKVYYVSPSISSFSATPAAGTYEIGRSLDSISFTWSLNKTVTKQTLDGNLLDVSLRSAKYESALSTGKTFTLAIEDAEGGKASKSLSYSFLPKVYYGGATLPESADSAFIVGLAKGDFKSSASGTYTMKPNDGQYGFVAIPKSYSFSGTAKVGGFDTDLTLVGTVSVTNASSYTQDYKLWRMPNPSDGGQISIVI